MQGELRILVLEDMPDVAELIGCFLRIEGVKFDLKLAGNREEFVSLLDWQPDIILSDYYLPSFNGLEAFYLAREKYPEIPYIFMSGSIPDDFPLNILRKGVTDYLMKDNLLEMPELVRQTMLRTEKQQEIL